MQTKNQSLPVKWYLLSFIGSLCLAAFLMLAFAVLAADAPTSATGLGASSTAIDTPSSASTISTTSQQIQPTVSPQVDPLKAAPITLPAKTVASESSHPPESKLPQRRRLWEMLVTTEIEVGAGVIVGLGIIAAALSAIAERRRAAG
jgi:hypothetical protein